MQLLGLLLLTGPKLLMMHLQKGHMAVPRGQRSTMSSAHSAAGYENTQHQQQNNRWRLDGSHSRGTWWLGEHVLATPHTMKITSPASMLLCSKQFVCGALVPGYVHNMNTISLLSPPTAPPVLYSPHMVCLQGLTAALGAASKHTPQVWPSSLHSLPQHCCCCVWLQGLTTVLHLDSAMYSSSRPSNTPSASRTGSKKDVEQVAERRGNVRISRQECQCAFACKSEALHQPQLPWPWQLCGHYIKFS